MPQACRPGAVGVLTYGCERTVSNLRSIHGTGGGDAQWRSLTISDIPVRTVRRARGLRAAPQDLGGRTVGTGGMLLSKDAIADVLEKAAAGRLLPAGAPERLRRHPRPYGREGAADAVTVGAGTGPPRPVAPHRWPAPHLHTLISTVPHGGQRRLLRGIVAEKAPLRRLVEAAPGWCSTAGAGPRAPIVDEIVDRAQAEIYDVTERRTSEDFVPLGTAAAADDGRDRCHRLTGRAFEGCAHRIHRTRRADLGLAPPADGRRRGEARYGKAWRWTHTLPTPTGWTTMGEVAVGDHLIGADGSPPGWSRRQRSCCSGPATRIEFSDGTA